MVLHLKYRPRTLDDVVGQPVTVGVLKNAFLYERFANAFLFTGQRGLGKTSLSRIVAKSFNCTNRLGYNPCNQCDDCLKIDLSGHVDVVEMDAASRTGVDDVRQIIENTNYVPAAKFKIYILDEAHMLSTSAFNALLKTLEEPPPRVKFILATTELRKLPATIVSRCQTFHLARVSVETLVDHMRCIAKSEAISVSDDAFHVIARAASGSVRDAISMFEQLYILCGDSHINKADALRMLGLPCEFMAADLINLILHKDCSGAVNLVDQCYSRGNSMSVLFGYILSSVDDMLRSAGFSCNDRSAQLCRLWELALRGIEDIHRAPNELHAAHIAVMRMVLLSDFSGEWSAAKGATHGDIEGNYAKMSDLLSITEMYASESFYIRNYVNLLTFNTGVLEVANDKLECDSILKLLTELTGRSWSANVVGEGKFLSYAELEAQKKRPDIEHIIAGSRLCAELTEEFGILNKEIELL